MIKTTLGALHAAVPILAALMDEKLPITQAVHAAGMAQTIQAKLEIYDQQKRKLFIEHGKQSAALGEEHYTIPPENMEVFLPLLRELDACEVELNHPPLKADKLAAATISAAGALALMNAGLLVEGEPA